MPTDSFSNPPGGGAFGEKAEMPYSPHGQEPGISGIKQVLRNREAELLKIEGVQGVGVGQDGIGNDAIVVYIRDSSVSARLPQLLEGYRVKTEITGIIEPLPLK